MTGRLQVCLEFGVLGPLRLTGDGDVPVVVSAARLRVLLAVLLWRVNRPVSMTELVRDGAPSAGAKALHALVMRLRRVLGEAGARIVTRAPGM
jgi:DNA-binding SARP family transcriptional activator